MTSFVLDQLEIKQSTSEFKEVVRNYANFLKQPLTLSMFVPCDEDGNILSEPSDYDYFVSDNEQYFQGDIGECQKYVEAKERVLFKGFEVKSSKIHENRDFIGWEIYNPSIFINTGNGWNKPEFPDFETIEDLTNFRKDIELTESAIKQIGL